MYNVDDTCNKMLYFKILCRIMMLNVRMCNIVYKYVDKCMIVSDNVVLYYVMSCRVG